jgi:MarR family 2-MHQ and catechol resistance regulon transcriptional repressor
MRAAESVTARTHRHLAQVGLTIGQFGALEALYHLGPLHQHDLARKLLRTAGDISTVVKNLARHELVRREPDTVDRRRIRVCLTPAGRRLIARVFPPHVAGIVTAFAVLRPAEQEKLRVLCRRLGLRAREADAPIPPGGGSHRKTRQRRV